MLLPGNPAFSVEAEINCVTRLGMCVFPFLFFTTASSFRIYCRGGGGGGGGGDVLHALSEAVHGGVTCCEVQVRLECVGTYSSRHR